MPNPQFSAVRQPFGCRLCRSTVVVVTIETPKDSTETMRLLGLIARALDDNLPDLCDVCMIRDQLGLEQQHEG